MVFRSNDNLTCFFPVFMFYSCLWTPKYCIDTHHWYLWLENIYNRTTIFISKKNLFTSMLCVKMAVWWGPYAALLMQLLKQRESKVGFFCFKAQHDFYIIKVFTTDPAGLCTFWITKEILAFILCVLKRTLQSVQEAKKGKKKINSSKISWSCITSIKLNYGIGMT